MRPSGRQPNEMRSFKIIPRTNRYAEGSCLVEVGDTQVLCTASVEASVPPFLRGTGRGWVTAEYSMLPRATQTRTPREAAKGKVTGRTQEIQRLIGRSLRSVIDLGQLGERQIIVDCDVIEADGGTRTAAITGGFVALTLAIETMIRAGLIKTYPITGMLAAVSCGIFNGQPVIDLDYAEDSKADMDANFVLTEDGRIVEIQCTAEEKPVAEADFNMLLQMAKAGVQQLCIEQRKAILGE
ncbi:MAG: ribonuclease PH [Rickettsiales bacterium]|nr:ribonuclease PH [Rickettsiales bacterium]